MRQIEQVLELLEKTLDTHPFRVWSHEATIEITMANNQYMFLIGRDFTKLTLRKNADYKTDIDVKLVGEMDEKAVKVANKAKALYEGTQYIRGSAGGVNTFIDDLQLLNSSAVQSLNDLKKEVENVPF